MNLSGKEITALKSLDGKINDVEIRRQGEPCYQYPESTHVHITPTGTCYGIYPDRLSRHAASVSVFSDRWVLSAIPYDRRAKGWLNRVCKRLNIPFVWDGKEVLHTIVYR